VSVFRQVEAFRAGVPVVASRQPALNELVHETGCGWGFEATSAAGLAGAVIDALAVSEAQRLSLTARARQLFLDRYTADRMIAAYGELYRRLQH
jgi:glycosyltransferase involved in cell wall biosynthesis